MAKGAGKEKAKAGNDPVTERISRDPGFALHYAAETGDISLAALRLESGKVDANYVDQAGFTPLFRAAMKKQVKFISFILEHGANPDAQTREGFTALMAVAESGNTEILQLLIDHKANPNLRNTQGTTSLHIAAALGHTKIIKMLLEAGADPSIRDNTDIRAILEAQAGQQLTVTDGHEEMLKGLRPVDVARMCGHDEAEEILKKAR